MVSKSVITSVTAPPLTAGLKCWEVLTAGTCLVLSLHCPDLAVDWVIGLVIPDRLFAQHHCSMD